jgi:hypothetical protein
LTFPFTSHGEVLVPRAVAGRVDAKHALNRLAAALERQHASDITRLPASVCFQVDLFRGVGNWNLLSSIDRGVVNASDEPEGLRIFYDLSFRRLFLVVTGMMALIVAPVVLLADMPVMWPGRAAALVAMWGWVVGGNYLSSAARFPRFVRRALSGDV